MTSRPKTTRIWMALILCLSVGACSNVGNQGTEPQKSMEPDMVQESVEVDKDHPSLIENESGVEGILWIGPTCPIVHEGTECPDEPYETAFTITDVEGELMAIGNSNADGFFHIPLHPGSYIFVPESGKPGVLPVAEPVSFDVEPNTFTFLEITFDSGIR